MQNANSNDKCMLAYSVTKKDFLRLMREAKRESSIDVEKPTCVAKRSKHRASSKLEATYVKEFTEYDKNHPIDFTLYKIVHPQERETMYVAYETDFLDKFDMYSLPTIWGDIPIKD
jgi:hypothetical protein